MKSLSQLTFAEFVLLIIAAIVLVAFWTQFASNLFYGTWHFDPNSTIDTLGISILLTTVFLAVVVFFTPSLIVPLEQGMAPL
jgi:hypothetical protein